MIVNKQEYYYKKLLKSTNDNANKTIEIDDKEAEELNLKEVEIEPGEEPVEPENPENTYYQKEYFTIENVSGETNKLIICKWDSYKEESGIQSNVDKAPDITVYYSFDKITWNLLGTTSTNNVGISVNFDNKIYLKSNTNTWSNTLGTYIFNDGITGDISYEISSGNNIVCTKQFIVYGNIMSLLYGDDFINYNTFETGHTFSNLFNASQNYSSTELQNNLLDASNLILPNTTSTYCYRQMFTNCKKIINTPKLPAKILSDSCYVAMFAGCTSLIEVPELPATIMKLCCYANMFSECKSLTIAPNLQAKTLAIRCYESMFQDCINLTKINELPAEILVKCCYYDMFNGCSNLNYIKCLATNINASYCTLNWVNDVSSTGTFIKSKDLSFSDIGPSGIPAGWEVIEE